MAFIRKHRLMLVPLFLVAALGAGVFLLLRSESEEPGNVGLNEPRVTVEAWQEDVSKRTQHGREYRFVRTVEYVDPETQETVTDEIVSTVRERGSNLCYRDAGGDWVPTVAEWERDGLGFKMDRNNWQIEVPQTLYSAYNYTVGGKTLAMRPTRILLSDGVHSVSLGEIDTNVAGEIDENDHSKLVFADVLGTGSGVDIELVLERASLHQNVVLRTKPALPEGFNEQTARLYVYTELGLDVMTADGSVGVKLGDTAVDVSATNLVTERNTTDPIAFVAREQVGGEARELVLHEFVESRVWDSAGVANETGAARQLWRSPNDLKVYLVESLPYAFLAEATGAVTIDYENRNGDIDEDETWRADATYYVSSDVSVASSRTLTIEPGTVVKFAEDSAINLTASGATIVAKGEPYRYIVMTSEEDDASGEDLTTGAGDPDAGDYDAAINIGSSASSDSAIEYCKIGYANTAITAATEINAIRHCIVSDCWNGITLSGSSRPDVFNSLICQIEFDGIKVTVSGDGSSSDIYNNTIDNCTNGILFSGSDSPSGTFGITNNLLTNNQTGINRSPSGWGTFNLVRNGYYGNASNTGGGLSPDSEAKILGTNPYDTSGNQLGARFIDTSGGGASLKNAGPANAHATTHYGDGTPGSNTLFEITAPEVVDSDITDAGTTTWEKRKADGAEEGSGDDLVDIGYHHPRVDKVINNTAIDIGGSSAVTLEIKAGVVVAFSGSSARLRFKSDAQQPVTLTCQGLPSEPIILAGKPVVSMNVEAQYVNASWWNYPHKGILLNDSTAAETASITYTHLMGLHKGIEIALDMDSSDVVRHCVFERGITSLYTTGGANRDITVSDCLFHDNVRGAIAGLAYCSTTTLTLRNCTFDRNEINLTLSSGTGATVDIKDCLFSNTQEGILLSSAIAGLTHNYNAFWECGPGNTKKIWKTYGTEGELPIGTDSVVLLKDPYDSSWTNWAGQWHLQQSVTKEGSNVIKDISLCVDGGSQTAVAAGLELFTTKLEDPSSPGQVWPDGGRVDIGYHYPLELEEDVSALSASNICFNGTVKFQLDVTFVSAVDWQLKVYSVATGDLVDTDSGTDSTSIDYEWDGEGQDDGVYRVEVSGPGFDTFTFYIYLDRAGPTGFKITFPETGATSGY
jgi:hypothetical protein